MAKKGKVYAWHVGWKTFDLYRRGLKTVFLFPREPPFTWAMAGKQFGIMNQRSRPSRINRTVIAVREYRNVYDAVESEDLVKIAHGDMNETIYLLERVYDDARLEKAFLAIEFDVT